MTDKKIKKIEAWLRENDIRFAFIADPTNVFYLTHFKCDPHERFLGLFIFPDEDPFMICPELEVGQAQASRFGAEVIGCRDDQNPWSLVKKALHARRHGGGPIAIEPATLPYRKAIALKNLYPDSVFWSIEALLAAMRAVKDAAEIEAMKKAGAAADEAIKIGIAAIGEGKTEQTIVAEINYEMARRGFPEQAFNTMVLAGENSAAPHGYPGNRRIGEGDFVLFDLGFVVDGYCSDITRTVCYKSASDKQRRQYETCLKANEEAIRAARSGMRIGDLDNVARKIIADDGYGAHFTHRIGHGLGLGEHEEPSMSADNDNQLKTGMVFTIEPGIYVPGIGGVRIEDDVLLTETGPVTLTHFPKELQVIQ